MIQSPALPPSARANHTRAYAYPVLFVIAAKMLGIVVWVVTPADWYQNTVDPTVFEVLLHRYIMLVAWSLNLVAIGVFFLTCWLMITILISLRPRWSSARIGWTGTFIAIMLAAVGFFVFGHEIGG